MVEGTLLLADGIEEDCRETQLSLVYRLYLHNMQDNKKKRAAVCA